MLDTVKALDKPPLIACSVRDILVPKNELWKEEWMADKALAYYDRVLVHADPDFITLADSFPFAHKVEDLVRYTGYVMRAGDRPEPPEGDGEDEVIVSCGGGALAEAFLSAAGGCPPAVAPGPGIARGGSWSAIIFRKRISRTIREGRARALSWSAHGPTLPAC